MFSELEAKIAAARQERSPLVPTLLGYLSRAEQAAAQGDNQKAEILIRRAMEE